MADWLRRLFPDHLGHAASVSRGIEWITRGQCGGFLVCYFMGEMTDMIRVLELRTNGLLDPHSDCRYEKTPNFEPKLGEPQFRKLLK
jgi:hypothetical protein